MARVDAQGLFKVLYGLPGISLPSLEVCACIEQDGAVRVLRGSCCKQPLGLCSAALLGFHCSPSLHFVELVLFTTNRVVFTGAMLVMYEDLEGASTAPLLEHNARQMARTLRSTGLCGSKR